MVVAVMVTALAWYKSIKSWIGLAKSAADGARSIKEKIWDWTPEKLRALVRLAFFSVITVAFSYIAAVVINAVVSIFEVDRNALYSLRPVESFIVITEWPAAAVWTVVVEAIGIGLLGIACIAELPNLRRFVLSVGGAARVVARLVGAIVTVPMGLLLCLELAISAFFAVLTLLGENGIPAPSPLYVTGTVTGILILLVAWSLEKIGETSFEAFGWDNA